MATKVSGSLLEVFVADTGSADGKPGAVPAPTAGDGAAGKFLKADGTWATAITPGQFDTLYIKRDGTNAPTANIPFGGNKITNLGTPTANADAATKLYVDNAVGSGGPQFTAGDGLVMATGNILNVGGTANRISVAADSVDIASTYVGQTSITTVGTITTGTWNGTAIAPSYGGTGTTTSTGTGSNVLSVSPTFSGTPLVPNAAVDTNTQQIASTAFVISQGYLKTATAATTYQPLNGNLTALSAVATNGLAVRTAANTWTSRSISGTGTDITVVNGDGVAGNPTISAGTNIPKKNAANVYTGVNTFPGFGNDANSNVFLGSASLVNASTNGFAYIPAVSGAPTGTPTTNAGRRPMAWDSANNILYIHNGTEWKNVGEGGGSGSAGDINPTPNTLALRDSLGDLYAVSMHTQSDIRTKENIEDVETTGILNLSAKYYNFIADTTKTKRLGLIAQDVQEHLPIAVKESETGLLTIDYNAVVVALLTEVKKLNKRITELENK